jgi:hypothetical protein
MDVLARRCAASARGEAHSEQGDLAPREVDHRKVLYASADERTVRLYSGSIARSAAWPSLGGVVET